METERKKKFITLRISILSAFSVLFTTTIISAVLFTYYNNSRAFLNVSEKLFQNISESVIDETVNHMMPACSVVTVSKHVISPDFVDEIQGNKLKDYCVSILRRNRQLVMFYYANEYGSWGAERRPNNVINRYELVRENPADKDAVQIYNFLDENNTVIGSEKQLSNFRGSIRPWYTGAAEKKGLFWTDLYTYRSSINQVGITVSYPDVDKNGKIKAVWGADIELEEMSDFLGTLHVGKRGHAMIIDENGKLIAYPGGEKLIIKGKDDQTAISLSDVYPWMSDIYEEHKKTKKEKYVIQIENEQRIVLFKSFPESFGKNWKIIIEAYENDFIGEVKHTNSQTLFFSLGALCISLIIISYASQKITRPIVALAHETDHIKDFRLDEEIQVNSFIREIQEIYDAVKKLKAGMRAFKKYVPSSVVKLVMNHGKEIEIGGQRRLITIFFSNVKSFTTITESLSPEQLTEQLSEYHSEMTAIINDCGGSVDKYIGDIVMAFWEQESTNEQMQQAIRAALLCKKRAKELNERWYSQGKPEFFVRCGIHTGETVIGNMGSSERMNYTLIGDSVNLAKRLESVNKAYDTSIIISEDVYQTVQEKYLCRPLDIVRVKGKNKPIKIYEVIGFLESCSWEIVEAARKFERGFEYYIEQNFEAAAALITESQQGFGFDKPCEILISRCQNNMKKPPCEQWSGERNGTRQDDITKNS